MKSRGDKKCNLMDRSIRKKKGEESRMMKDGYGRKETENK